MGCCFGGGCEERVDGGGGEGGEDCSGSEPGGEIGFEGELVGVACVAGFTGLFYHDVVLEEDRGGVEDAICNVFPRGTAISLE